MYRNCLKHQTLTENIERECHSKEEWFKENCQLVLSANERGKMSENT